MADAPGLVLHPGATVGASVTFGANVIVHDGVVLGDGVVVQDNTGVFQIRSMQPSFHASTQRLDGDFQREPWGDGNVCAQV